MSVNFTNKEHNVPYFEFEKLKDNYYNFVINQTDFQSEIKQNIIHMKEIQNSISQSVVDLMFQVNRFSELNSEKKGMVKGAKFVIGAIVGFISCIVAFVFSPAFDHSIDIV